MKQRKSPTGITVNNKSITVRFNFEGVPHKHTLRLSNTSENIKYAERQRAIWIDKLTRGERVEEFHGKRPTIGMCLNKWLSQAEGTIKASTFKGYNKHVTALIAEFGAIHADTLTIGMVRDYCIKLECSHKTILNRLSPLRLALNIAFEDGDVTTNVLANWTFSKNRMIDQDLAREKRLIKPFTLEEQSLILTEAKGQIRNLFHFAFWSGLRTSELVALRWEDIDFKKGIIHVCRAKTQDDKQAGKTKTLRSTRDVVMLDQARIALNDQREHTQLLKAEVFHNPKRNRPFDGDQDIRRVYWIPLLEEAGVEYRTPYQTRHTYASMMLMAGENPIWVSQQMGHTDLAMVNTRYGRWISEKDDSSGSKANGLVT